MFNLVSQNRKIQLKISINLPKKCHPEYFVKNIRSEIVEIKLQIRN